jgi:hypothetical protein
MEKWRAFGLWALVVVGGAGAVAFGWYALKDWAALQTAERQFETLAGRSADLSALFVAEAKQNIHRINLFAQGVWTLLSAIVAAIGVHGLCAGKRLPP